MGAEILSNKIRQSKLVKGINIYGNEVKVSQFADNTNLFCEDITSVDKALCLVNDFAPVSGLKLNVKKTKALWLGKWRNNRTTPLQLSWPRDPVKILGIYFSYDDKSNDHYNFNLKIQKLQTHLDMWSSRSLTLFGKVLIIKSLGLSQILYSASNTNVPKDTITIVKRKLFSFLWNKKKDKIKREGLYQDYDKGGIRMTEVGLMLKAMRLAWIPRLLKHPNSNWNSVPDFFLRRLGGLNFLLRCNYDVIFLNSKLPTFYKDMLSFFDDLKTLYNYNLGQIVLFNNREILIDGKPFFIQEWFSKGIILIRDLLDEQGQLLSYQAFKTKYKCKTNFLNYYQVRSAIPDSLLAKTKNNNLEPFSKSIFLQNHSIFDLDSSTKVNFETAKVKDFYWLLNKKVNNGQHTGPTKWSKSMPICAKQWEKFFISIKQVSRENKLREFHFKFLHRIVVTKQELCRYGIKDDSECLYCGEQDSIEHTLSDCLVTKDFLSKVVQWFNNCNPSSFKPSNQEYLFGIFSNPANRELLKKFNYTLLFARYFIYTNKLHNNPLLITDFVSKITSKYRLENLD